VPTNRTIPNNKSDIIIYDNEKGRCVSIDIAISGGRNVIKKDAEKIVKYKKDITTEIRKVHVECKNISYGQIEQSQNHSENI